MTLYRTIVADPPWALEWNANIGLGRSGRKGLPYPTMTVEEICCLPVADMAERDAHLWMWTTATFLWDAPRVVLDEPLSGVDVSGEAALYHLIAEIRDEIGCGA